MCSSEVVRAAAANVPAGSAEPQSRESEAGSALRHGLFSARRRVQDLTHTVSADFPVFPGDRSFESREARMINRDGYALSELRFSEHTGTHLDAPAHFFADGSTAERISPADLVVPLAVISMVERARRDHDAALSVDDVEAWERRHGRIPAGAVVAIYSGWEERLHAPSEYLNMDSSGVMHSPGFGGAAAELLTHERGIAGIAVDTLSLDIGASSEFEAHRIVLGAGRYGLENVANLGRVPPAGATLVVGGPKHRDATGGPARLLAIF